MRHSFIGTVAALVVSAVLLCSAEEAKMEAKPAPKIERDKAGLVTIAGEAGMEVRYWVTGPHATQSSVKYEAPFTMAAGGKVFALSVPPDGGPVISEKSVASAEFPAIEGAVAPQPVKPPPHEAGWMDVKPAPFEAVKAVNKDFPLSDQENKGGWVKYELMCDEFTGDKLDATKWWPNNPTWKGRYPGLFRKENVVVKDGQMHLTMKKEPIPATETDKKYKDYTCAAVQSKTRVRYGYFECRARAMKSAGSSAFWLYDSTKPWWTEIDILETGYAPGFERKHHITMHFWHTPVENKHWAVGSAFVAPANLADDFHVYGLDWDEKELKFYFDGMLIRKGPNTHWHQPQTLNFDSETMPDWFKMPKDEDLPSTFSVEYVRVWKKK